MGKSFDELVKEGSDQGLDRPKAEARARDLLYGDPPAAAPASAPEAFASVDELWTFLQATWESRSTGAELVDVLESINDLLDRGVISQEQFREVMQRTKEQQKEPNLYATAGSNPGLVDPRPRSSTPSARLSLPLTRVSLALDRLLTEKQKQPKKAARTATTSAASASAAAASASAPAPAPALGRRERP